MRKYLICIPLMAALATMAAQPADVSIRQVRDPVQLRSWINESLNDWIGDTAEMAFGAKNGATVTANEKGSFVNKTVLTMAATPVSVIYTGGTTNAIGSTKIYDFPAGRVLVLGVTVEGFDIVAFPTNTMDIADGGDFSFGTAVPGADGVLDGTAVDFAPATSIDPITNVVNTALAASAQFDGTSTPVDLYVNVSIDNTDLTGYTTNALTVGGAVTIHWINLGDY